MHSSTKSKLPALLLAALGLFGPAAAPTASAGGARLGPPTSGPVAGPIEVFAFAETVPGPVGSLVETTLVVENQGSDPAQVFLIGLLEWPDGSTQILRYGPPVTIAPDGALVIIALSLIPPSVGSGPATFTAQAIVGAIGTGGRRAFAGPLFARDSASFQIP